VYLTPPVRGYPRNFVTAVGLRKARVLTTQYRQTDRWTDRQTDEQKWYINIVRDTDAQQKLIAKKCTRTLKPPQL